MTEKRKKVLMISDHPMAPSGVGTQTRYILDALLKTGRYEVVCLAGAMKHNDYTPQRFEDTKELLTIYPVDNYGNPDVLRSAIRTERPDVLWMMTDPRFFYWLFAMENEIRPLLPIVYNHVWDNYPLPLYNKPIYQSTDVVVGISKLTHDIVTKVSPTTESRYIPHAVNPLNFKRFSDTEIHQFKSQNFPDIKDKMVFFWNNRNARRKQPGSLLFWFKSFLDKVGHDKASLVLHTEPIDEMHGQDLPRIIQDLGLNDKEKGQVYIHSNRGISAQQLAMFYSMSDATINISDAEGFGLATLESLSCETPIIVTMTGGLQEQVTDGENWFGFGIEPCSKAIIGSGAGIFATTYIAEDRISEKDFVDAMVKFYNLSKEERTALCQAGKQHVEKNYSFSQLEEKWVALMDKTIDKHGSWETRKGHKSYEVRLL